MLQLFPCSQEKCPHFHNWCTTIFLDFIILSFILSYYSYRCLYSFISNLRPFKNTFFCQHKNFNFTFHITRSKHFIIKDFKSQTLQQHLISTYYLSKHQNYMIKKIQKSSHVKQTNTSVPLRNSVQFVFLNFLTLSCCFHTQTRKL